MKSYLLDYFNRHRYRTATINSPNRYNVLTEIGNGTYGVVYKARDRATLKSVAIKKAKTEGDNGVIDAEINRYGLLGEHANVTRLIGSFDEPFAEPPGLRRCIIIEPFVSNTLAELIQKHKKRDHVKLAPIKVQSTMFQILKAANYLRQRNLIHQDLKPDNILVHPNTGYVVLTDWGSLQAPASTRTPRTCTIGYRPPESQNGKLPYTIEYDTWSIGAIMAEMYRGVQLFKVANDEDELFAVQSQVLGNPLAIDYPSIFPPDSNIIAEDEQQQTATIDSTLVACKTPVKAKALIKSMLKFKPADRLPPIQAMADGFFDDLRAARRYRKLFEFTAAEVAGVDQTVLARVKPQSSIIGASDRPVVRK